MQTKEVSRLYIDSKIIFFDNNKPTKPNPYISINIKTSKQDKKVKKEKSDQLPVFNCLIRFSAFLYGLYYKVPAETRYRLWGFIAVLTT